MSLAQLQRDHEAAQRAVPALEKTLAELGKTQAKAKSALDKATADHETAVSAQKSAETAFTDEQSEATEAKLEKADKRVRLARLALDAATAKHVAATNDVAQGEVAKRNAERDASRLGLELSVHPAAHQAAVDADVRKVVEGLRTALAGVKAVAARRKKLAETARAHAAAGHGSLELPDPSRDFLVVLEELAAHGVHPRQALISALASAPTRNEFFSTSVLDRAPDMLTLLVTLLSETDHPPTPNRGIETSEAIGAVAAKMRETGAAWRAAQPHHGAPVTECPICLQRGGAHANTCNAPRPPVGTQQIPRTWG